ncbi:hypothetical protein KOR34_00610 [Posidoniimonas corsicana]|uniref:Uncharacterized protein n=1 Tax=Posidoniimonas corsicana TaxID=1938618 RepID=A0A5C5VB21_9BACT|nr:hypothetical protein [Posidoniimonas corsicana]TWT35173.1 hypothetical protein KOR34_00610 [Posidoniimonas corsicana]
MSRRKPTGPRRKLGQGSVSGMLRQGHKEIGRLWNAVEEPGVLGTATPMLVSIQTGVSPQPQTSREFQTMSATEPHEIAPPESILDNLIEQAAEMAQPEMEPEIER